MKNIFIFCWSPIKIDLGNEKTSFYLMESPISIQAPFFIP